MRVFYYTVLNCLFLIFYSFFTYAQCTVCTTTISTDNSSTITLTNSAQTLCITGGTFTGSVELQNGANICIGTGATFTPSSFSVNNTGTTITNYGDFTIGTFTLSATLINRGDLTISGSLTVSGSGSIDSNGSSFNVTGSMTIQNDVTIVGNASVGGSLTVTGGGDLTLQDGEFSVGGSFENQGTVSAAGASSCGQISVAGASKNIGNFGTDDSSIDICDSSGGADDGFDDNQRTLGSNVTSCTCSDILPVDLISFSGSYTKENVLLLWATASELNSSHFEVERSTDGQNFDAIATIPSAGNSKQLINYKFEDVEMQATNSIIYYRLKQVDMDETMAYSKVIAITIDETIIQPLFQYHPHDQSLSISNVSNTLPVQVNIYQLDGTLLQQLTLNSDNSILFDKRGTGVYIVHYQYGNQQGIWRFFKK